MFGKDDSEGQVSQDAQGEGSRGVKKQNFTFSSLIFKKAIGSQTGVITSLCILDETRMASSVGKIIEIFEMNTFQCELILKGHYDTVFSIAKVDTNKLASSSIKVIKIWDLQDKKNLCIKTIQAHISLIYKIIKLADKNFCSCSNDKTIKVWDFGDYKCQYTLTEHTGPVLSVIELHTKRYIVSGSEDNSVRFWDTINAFKCEKVIKGIRCCWNNSFTEFGNSKLIVGGIKYIAIINVQTFQVESVVQEYQLGSVFSILILPNNTAFCGCSEGKFCQLDLNACRVLEIAKKMQMGNVNVIIEGFGYLLTASNDKSICLWEFSSV